MCLLEVHPELWAGAKESGQAQHGVGRDGTPAMHDVSDARGGNANPHRQRVLAQSIGDQKIFPQYLTWVGRDALDIPSRGGFLIALVVVGDFDIVRSIFRPHKTDAVLIVDADAVLPIAVARKRLQAISGRRFQVVEGYRLLQIVQFAQSYCLNIFPAAIPTAFKQLLRVLVSEALDHLLRRI